MIKDVCLVSNTVLVHCDPDYVEDTFNHKDGPLKLLIMPIEEADKLHTALGNELKKFVSIEQGSDELKD